MVHNILPGAPTVDSRTLICYHAPMLENSREPEKLKFPIECQFRIIAASKPGMHFMIETVLIQLGITAPLHTENQSQSARYQSYRIDVVVESLEAMNRIDSSLRSIAGVRMVL